MSDRTIRIMERGKLVCRGLTQTAAYNASLALSEGDVSKVTMDWSEWLDGDTIASVDNTVTGQVEITSAATATPEHSFKVSGTGPGLIEHRITTTTGAETKTLRIWVGIAGNFLCDDYVAS